jgi:hypothetical protein
MMDSVRFGARTPRLPDDFTLRTLSPPPTPGTRASVRLAAFLIPVLGSVLLAACGQSLKDGMYRDGDVAYQLEPVQTGWKAADFSGNDLAWTSPHGHVIAVNATCEDHGDPPLKVLTDHLLMGFEDRVVASREELMLDGRGALRSRITARLDGVPVDLELTVMKKDGCIYDFTYTSPQGRFDERVDDYHRLVGSFRTGRP